MYSTIQLNITVRQNSMICGQPQSLETQDTQMCQTHCRHAVISLNLPQQHTSVIFKKN